MNAVVAEAMTFSDGGFMIDGGRTFHPLWVVITQLHAEDRASHRLLLMQRLIEQCGPVDVNAPLL